MFLKNWQKNVTFNVLINFHNIELTNLTTKFWIKKIHYWSDYKIMVK